MSSDYGIGFQVVDAAPMQVKDRATRDFLDRVRTSEIKAGHYPTNKAPWMEDGGEAPAAVMEYFTGPGE